MQELAELASRVKEPLAHTRQVFIGFDGVTDELLDVVDRWKEQGNYAPMEMMSALGQRILDFAGKSCNIDIIPKLTKIGGNGPILARALVEGGHDIFLVGPLGANDEIEPLFFPLKERCKRIVSLAESAYTQALEFKDGKVMLGKLQTYANVTWDKLLKKIPLSELIAIHDELDLFVSGSWTNVLGTNRIWQGIIEEVIPRLSKRSTERPRWMYVDLADPAKRTEEDIRTALKHLEALGQGYSVILGLNRSEAKQIGALLGYHVDAVDRTNMESVAAEIHKRLPVTRIVLHAARYVALSHEEGTSSLEVPHCEAPKIQTGAGDNFNAGFCNGLLRGFSPLGCLVTGVGTAGYYIRHAASPTMPQLASFFLAWQEGTC